MESPWTCGHVPWHDLRMSTDTPEPTYISRVHVVRERGPYRLAYLPAETEPVAFSTHGAVSDHYGGLPEGVEPRATTLDYVVAAAAG